MTLRELAEAYALALDGVNHPHPTDEQKTVYHRARASYIAACSPERILALLDVVEAAEETPEHMTASSKARWWREDGMAGAAVADRKLRAALTRWQEVRP